MLKLEKYSLGTGDRFGRQARAQLRAVMQGAENGSALAIVWNKSYREHHIIHTSQEEVRRAAEEAVKDLNWTGGYHVDADHINIENVDLFISASDFFTLDVAEYTGRSAPAEEVEAFVRSALPWVGPLKIPGLETPPVVTEAKLRRIAERYLLAVKEAGRIYRHIEAVKGEGQFITEVSMDETDEPQTPEELFFILKAIADEGIPAQTIAPKFTGRFNKGVDYVGDLSLFDREFGEDIQVIAAAVQEFGLPENLKLSVHSGSDKFSLYPIIRYHLHKHNAGLHLKTAGTTWLEEVIGLAESNGAGLALAKEIYRESLKRYDELTGIYATVIDIDTGCLPSPERVAEWTAVEYAAALRHETGNPAYNRHFRQLLHVGFKVAADMGERYLETLDSCRELVGKNVTTNLLDRHIRPLFLG